MKLSRYENIIISYILVDILMKMRNHNDIYLQWKTYFYNQWRSNALILYAQTKHNSQSPDQKVFINLKNKKITFFERLLIQNIVLSWKIFVSHKWTLKIWQSVWEKWFLSAEFQLNKKSQLILSRCHRNVNLSQPKINIFDCLKIVRVPR